MQASLCICSALWGLQLIHHASHEMCFRFGCFECLWNQSVQLGQRMGFGGIISVGKYSNGILQADWAEVILCSSCFPELDKRAHLCAPQHVPCCHHHTCLRSLVAYSRVVCRTLGTLAERTLLHRTVASGIFFNEFGSMSSEAWLGFCAAIAVTCAGACFLPLA